LRAHVALNGPSCLQSGGRGKRRARQRQHRNVRFRELVRELARQREAPLGRVFGGEEIDVRRGDRGSHQKAQMNILMLVPHLDRRGREVVLLRS
jgi:hypothetical protein